MSLIVISIDREKLPPHTDEDFEEWVKFWVGEFDVLKDDNPLGDSHGMDAKVMEIG